MTKDKDDDDDDDNNNDPPQPKTFNSACFISRIREKRKICEEQNEGFVEDNTVHKPQTEVQEESVGKKQNIMHCLTVLCYMQFNKINYNLINCFLVLY
jgi:hypothetical protein